MEIKYIDDRIFLKYMDEADDHEAMPVTSLGRVRGWCAEDQRFVFNTSLAYEVYIEFSQNDVVLVEEMIEQLQAFAEELKPGEAECVLCGTLHPRIKMEFTPRKGFYCISCLESLEKKREAMNTADLSLQSVGEFQEK